MDEWIKASQYGLITEGNAGMLNLHFGICDWISFAIPTTSCRGNISRAFWQGPSLIVQYDTGDAIVFPNRDTYHVTTRPRTVNDVYGT